MIEPEKRYIEKSKNYFIGEDGNVYRKNDQDFNIINGWINKTRSGRYRRAWIFYLDGTSNQMYHHMLVAIYFCGGDKRDEGLLVLHGVEGNLENKKENIKWGTAYENQVEDRKRDGNYYNRGKRKEAVDDLPF